jgi:two-component system, chemotaxis family, response regulator PixG
MFHLFNAVDFLREASLNEAQGRLQIDVPGLSWVLHFKGDRIEYAFHPLQRLDHLEQAMQAVNLDIGCRLGECLSAWELGMPLSIAVTELVQQQRLSPTQGDELLAQLTEDALEPLLWINEGKTNWTPSSELEAAHITGIGIKVEPYLARMQDRLQQWQTLFPEFRSPYQRPYIEAIDRIAQPVQGGMLPQSTLESIVRLMEGRTLQQLALLLKLDPLKLAQLLHPYCRQGIIRLGDIPSPLDGLPQIPVAITASIQTHYPKREEQNHSDLAHRQDHPIESNSTEVRRHKVVCIDDSPTILETIERYLGSDQFEVATVENPMASLSALFDLKPDLILMDVSMPGIDGNRLCTILKRSSVFTNVPIIMVSGNTGMLDKEKAKAAGATDYLTKPFSKAELLAMVEGYLQLIPA